MTKTAKRRALLRNWGTVDIQTFAVLPGLITGVDVIAGKLIVTTAGGAKYKVTERFGRRPRIRKLEPRQP